MAQPAQQRNGAGDDHGLLLVDKPRGPTSHDVVAWTRRALGVRTVGHAGTLDPMATGLLVLAVGEATKLLRYLATEDKTYLATIVLGTETDTLDAEGKVVNTHPGPVVFSRASAETTARSFVGVMSQRAPAVSAIKSGGVPLYRRARQGERVEAPERQVVVHELSIVDVREREIDLAVRCGSGFYVRALARDFSRALGTVGHLCALRRTASGRFDVRQAVELGSLRPADASSATGAPAACTATRPSAAGLPAAGPSLRALLRDHLIPLLEACGEMPRLTLSDAGCEDAFHGRPIDASRVASGTVPDRDLEPIALVNSAGQPVAIARSRRRQLQVVRGLRLGR